MKYLFALLLGALIHMSYAKSTKVETQKAERSPQDMYTMDCREVGRSIFRCANAEITCYQRYKTGLQCKFK